MDARQLRSKSTLYDIIKGVIPCMGTFPGRARAHQPEREQEHAHQHATFGSAAQDLLKKDL